MGSPGAEVAIDSSSADTTAGEESAEGPSVMIADIVFAPPALTVAAGTTVTWTNEAWAPHTATAEDGSFDSDRLDQGASLELTYDESGTFGDHCSFHPGMVGSVVVT